MKKPASEEGATLVIAALGMLVILGFAALAIDIGIFRFSRRHLQAVTDAAALAGALEVSACQGASNCAALKLAVQTAFAENGMTGGVLESNCDLTSGAGLTIVVNNPPCFQGSGDPNNGKAGYVEVVAYQPQISFFTSFLGFKTFPISVRAEAVRTPNPNCVYSLDPSGGNAISVDLLSFVSSGCGIVNESSAWNAFSCNLVAQLSAPTIEVNGGMQGLLCLSGTTPRVGVPAPTPADPLAALPKPAVLPCGSSLSTPYHGSPHQLLIGGAATLYPDASYCGGVVIGPLANVTFTPGTYVLRSDPVLTALGGLTVNPLATVNSSAATFYNYGPNGGITFLAPSVPGHVSMLAPTSGTYACMLFFQDPQDTASATILASSTFNTKLEGIFYLPNASVLYASSTAANYNMIIAKDVEFVATGSLQSAFSNNYSSIVNGCPVAGGGSALVQ